MLQPSPLKRNLVLRLRKEGKHKNVMKDALVVEIREYWNSREEDLHGLPCSFSFHAWVTEPVAESGYVVFITWPSRSDNFIRYSR
jgi:hypothetical protein